MRKMWTRGLDTGDWLWLGNVLGVGIEAVKEFGEHMWAGDVS